MELLFIATKNQYFKVIADTVNIISVKWLFPYTEHVFNMCIKYTKQ
jgi:hypothetical protein